MIKGEYILATGVVIDMISTIVGINKGFAEGNLLGLPLVLILNTTLLYVMLFTINLKRPKVINILLYVFGVFRVCVGLWNTILIS